MFVAEFSWEKGNNESKFLYVLESYFEILWCILSRLEDEKNGENQFTSFVDCLTENFFIYFILYTNYWRNIIMYIPTSRLA